MGIGSNIGVAVKQCLTIIATLNNVDREPDWTVSSAPGHTTLHMSVKFTPCSPATAIQDRAIYPTHQSKNPDKIRQLTLALDSDPVSFFLIFFSDKIFYILESRI
jgi:hypothetical protein